MVLKLKILRKNLLSLYSVGQEKISSPRSSLNILITLVNYCIQTTNFDIENLAFSKNISNIKKLNVNPYIH